MAKDEAIAINDAVHKIQLAMLDGITDQKQLLAAGSLMSRLDYEDVVTERTIAKLCGYPLCRTSLPSEVSRRGKYRISLKEHKVYDLEETRKFCSADCLISSGAFSGSLQDARTSGFDTAKLKKVLGLFSGSVDVNADLGLSKLTIRENVDVRGGELSLDQWMGPSNAVEGYVPIERSNSRMDPKAEPPFSPVDFTSTVIFPDQSSVSKPSPQTRQAEDGQRKTVLRGEEQTATKKKSRFRREKEKDRQNYGFEGICCEASAIMSDGYSVEYSVSKQPPGSVEDKLGNKVICVEYTTESCMGPKAQDVCSSSETVTKSCLKSSGSKKLSRSVTWADQNDGCGDLCEVKNNDIKAGFNLPSTDSEDFGSVSRLALAEVCALALSQPAEAIASGNSDASDTAAKAGIVLLPSTHQFDEEVDEEVSEEDMQEEISDEEPTLFKWPNKPGIPDSDLFDRDQSWFDGPPEGFNLSLSNFAMMWDALFGWVSSSSLAYIYGKDQSAHEEFLLVNGKEYLRKIILGDGLSSEIKETIAGCLARALPRVATDLRLPIAISELEKGLGSLLETMSLTGAVPSFRVEQWLVIVLLFLDALSVSRIPRIAPCMLSRNKILEGSGIGNEEYETMKEILLPLGRVPQFATRSGA